MKRLSLAGIAIASLVLAGCTTKVTPQATPSADTSVNSPALGTIPPSSSDTMMQSTSPGASDSATNGSSDVKVIDIESFSFGFTPNKIEVNKGDKVQINVKNTGGFHNFEIPDYNIEVQTPADQITKVEFTADKSGTFEFKCGVGNHAQQGQKGTLTVK